MKKLMMGLAALLLSTSANASQKDDYGFNFIMPVTAGVDPQEKICSFDGNPNGGLSELSSPQYSTNISGDTIATWPGGWTINVTLSEAISGEDLVITLDGAGVLEGSIHHGEWGFEQITSHDGEVDIVGAFFVDLYDAQGSDWEFEPFYRALTVKKLLHQDPSELTEIVMPPISLNLGVDGSPDQTKAWSTEKLYVTCYYSGGSVVE